MKYELKKLPYDYGALEPHLDHDTMKLHHTKHHQAYVDNANAAHTAIQDSKDPQTACLHAKKYDDNVGGIVNHELFFFGLAPKSQGGGVFPTSGEFFNAVVKRYHSFSELKEKLIQAGLSRFGSGWVFLTQDLEIVTTPNQEPLRQGRAILGIDVWEHAYYLKFNNRRADYLKEIFEVINWKHAEDLFLQK